MARVSKGASLTALEQLVLLSIVRLKLGAYGVAIGDDIFAVVGRRYAPGALYAALDRLRADGLVAARLGEPERRRGGRAKMIFGASDKGLSVLRDSLDALDRMREGVVIHASQ